MQTSVAEHPIPSSLFHPISISTSTSTTMVSFHVPPPIVTDASNDETMLSDELLVGDDKKRYRMTPHPNSKQAVRVGDPHGKPLSDISNMDACVSTIPSPEMERTNASTSQVELPDDAGENDNGVDAPSETAEDREWNEWMMESLEEGKQDAAPNLQAYLYAKATREDAKKTFETALDECLQAMTRAMTEELLDDTVGVVYEEQGARFEAHESTIIATIQSNHDRRGHLMHQMEHANANWGRQYKKIRASILEHTASPTSGFRSAETDHTQEEEITTIPPPTPGSASDEDGARDPNWDEIGQYGPARQNARAFVAAREKLRDADDALSQALEEIHAGLKADADAIAQVVIDFYKEHENESLTLEQDIQYHLMNSCQRRDAFEQSLQESAKQTQGVIAKLLSRLSSGQKHH